MENIFEEIPIGFIKMVQGIDGCQFRHGTKKMFVIVDENHVVGDLWRHVSVSKRDDKGRMIDVSWEEICEVKDKFIGDRYAYMVFPPKEFYVNISHVFHLWANMSRSQGKVLPEFSGIKPGIGRSI